jgi:flagellar motor switch protein FliM
MEVRLGDCLETLQLAFPYFTVEPLVRQLSQESQQDKNGAVTGPQKIVWNQSLDDVKTRLTAEWKGLKLTAGQLGSLKLGDIIPLDAESLTTVQVRVEDLPKFRARLGTCGNRWAVELLDSTPKTL